MNVYYVVDRFEGQVAVILGEGESEVSVPRRDLPEVVHEGSVLRVPMGDQGPDWRRAVVDDAEGGRRVAEARDRIARLRRRDPGGDLAL